MDVNLSNSKFTKSDPKDFEAIEAFAKRFDAKGRTESAALLIWFLQAIYRLDDIEAEDAVCDRKFDEGFDAIFVNDSRREIAAFQCKRKKELPGTLGDVDLKTFVGSLMHLNTKASVDHLIAMSKNPDLVKLLKSLGVAEKVEAGYTIKPIFVCNIAANSDADKYLPQAKNAGHVIELWDLKRLSPVVKQLSREWFIDEQATIRLPASKSFLFGAKTQPSLVYGVVKATQLVKLPGIDDLRLFAQNVRLGLGNTRVNTEIVESVKNKKEHPNFKTFHNGLTIVAKSMRFRRGKILLKDFSVCNGCQSLLSLWENRNKLTDELEILVRIVRVGQDRQIAEQIAYRTNNQNPISLRDLSSNDTAQVHLKNAFDYLFSKFAVYGIKRGEPGGTNEIVNEQAGRLILALYVKEPWSAHQKYRIFGDLEGRIFDYELKPAHIRFAQLMSEIVSDEAKSLSYDRIAKYGLSHYILVYLVGEVLRLGTDGKTLLKDPLPYLSTNTNDNSKQKPLLDSMRALTKFVITELNYFIKENGEDSYDYKTSFKSQTDVHLIRNAVQKAFEKDVTTGRAKQFKLH
jgi:hypothetical protein